MGPEKSVSIQFVWKVWLLNFSYIITDSWYFSVFQLFQLEEKSQFGVFHCPMHVHFIRPIMFHWIFFAWTGGYYDNQYHDRTWSGYLVHYVWSRRTVKLRMLSAVRSFTCSILAQEGDYKIGLNLRAHCLDRINSSESWPSKMSKARSTKLTLSYFIQV